MGQIVPQYFYGVRTCQITRITDHSHKRPIRFVFDNSTVLILELHGGEGGEDSKLFVGDLLTAYLKYAENSGFQYEELLNEHGHAMYKIMGKGVWKAFKNEPGKHVVQRVPPTERNGRRQTSVVTVAVLPPQNAIAYEPLLEKDLEIKFQVASGPGGQHRNKTASACRMRHTPTGLEVFISKGRDQHANKREALEILTKRVNEQKRLKITGDYNSNRKSQMTSGGDEIGGRGDKVRTYNYIRGEITDSVLNKSTYNIKAFMKGDFSVLFGE